MRDSVTYLFQAQLFALGRLSAPAPALAEFFEQEFMIVHNGVWFGKYLPGAPLVLTLGVLANAPWLASPVLLGGAVALTYLSGRRLYGPGVAAIAAVLMLTPPFLLLMGGDMMAHPSGLFWTSLLLYATVRCIDGAGRLPWMVAGAAFGMLFLTRQLTAVSVAAPLLLVLGLHSLRSPARLPGRAGLFLLGAGPLIAFLLFFNWSLVGNPLRSPYELWWGFDRVGFGPTIGMHGAHDVANGLSNTWANTAELMRHLYGWPAYLTLAPAMVPLILVSRKWWDWVLAAGAASLAVAYVAYWADGIMYSPRY